MQLVIIIILTTGLVLLYSAIKGEDPRELIKRVLQRNK